MRKYLNQQKTDTSKIHLTFEVSGQAGYLYDSLAGYADTITVNNPSQMTWIFRTSNSVTKIMSQCGRKLCLTLDRFNSINELNRERT